MNGVHDLGGMDGFGPVEVEQDEPVFHAAWEKIVFVVAGTIVSRVANVHQFRHAIERMEPMHYLASSYYEHWLTAAATLAVEKGMISAAELEEKVGGTFPLSRPVREEPRKHPFLASPTRTEALAGEVSSSDHGLAGASPSRSSSGAAPLFAAGEAVIVRNPNPFGHTRCPRYVRGKRGVVVRVDARYALPDAAARDDTSCDQFQYCVRFPSHELWGEGASPAEAVHVDLSEGYLEKA
jgi:nitrile hydratase